jgi:sugar lactone lactonase YvrE
MPSFTARHSVHLRSVCSLLIAIGLIPAIAHAQAAATAVSIGNAALGSSTTSTLIFNFTSVTTVTGVSVVTQGAANLDFTLGTQSLNGCTAKSYNTGDICTVIVNFSPLAPGIRLGAAVLSTSSGIAVGTGYISGVGLGSLPVLSPGLTKNFSTAVNSPRGPSVTAAGDIYFTDSTSSKIFKIPAGSNTAALFLTTASGTNGSTTVDGAGNLYFGSPSNNAIYEVLAGTTTPISIAGYSTPDDIILVDGAGNIYVSNSGTGAIVKFAGTSQHTQSTVLAGGVISRIIGMAVDASGNIFAADFNNNAIFRIADGSGAATKIISADGYLNQPHGLAFDPAGNIYVTNYGGSSSILEYQYNAANNTYAGAQVITEATGHQGIAIDSSGDLIYMNGTNVGMDTRSTTPTVAFPSTYNTTTSLQKTVTLESDGNVPLTLSSLTISAGYALTGSSETCSAPSSMPINATCVLAPVFEPTNLNETTGTVSIAGNFPTTETFGVSGILEYGPYTQTVTFNAPTSPVDIFSSQTLTATSSAYRTVSFYIISGPGVINGTTLSYTGNGTVTIGAIQYGDEHYQPSPVVTQTVSVNQAAPVYTGPTSPVNTPTAGTAAVVFTAAGTIGQIQALFRGAQNKDFTLASGGSCTVGTAYNSGNSCIVNYTFNPQHPGIRPGGITILDTSGNLMGFTLISSATGTGPQLVFISNRIVTTLGSPVSTASEIALDGNDNVFVVASGTNQAVEMTAASNYTTMTTLPGPLAYPSGIATDGLGNVFVMNSSPNSNTGSGATGLVKYSAFNNYQSGFTTFEACVPGSNCDGKIAITSAGDLFFDQVNQFFYRYVYSNGTWGANNDNQSFSQYFLYVTSMSIDPMDNVLITDENTLNQEAATSFSPPGYPAPHDFDIPPNYPPSSAAGDAAGNRFIAFDDGTIQAQLTSGSMPTVATGFNFPGSQLLDSSGNLFIADTSNNVVKMIDFADPPTLTFPSTYIGSTSATQTVTLLNGGNAQLNFSSVLSASSNFTVESTTCGAGAQVATGGTCTITVAFTPQAPGTPTSAVNVVDNHLNVSGTTQSIIVTGTAAPTPQTISFSPATSATAGSSGTLSATASSGLPVTFAIVSGPGTIYNNVIEYNGPGIITVLATQVGNLYYKAATQTAYVTVGALTAPNLNSPTSTLTDILVVTTAGTTAGGAFAFTNGMDGGDFQIVSGGTCTAGTYNVGDTCTVNYTFSPSYPGARPGALMLSTGAGIILGTTYVEGTGYGSLMAFSPAVSSNFATGLNGATAIAVDDQNQFFYAQQGAKTLTRQLFGSAVIASNVNAITGVVVDAAGNVFYGSYGDNKIYELVGGGNAPIPVASVPSPDIGMTIDAAGNLYVPSGSSVIKVQASTFATSTIATVTGASVVGVAVDYNNNVFFTDYLHNNIYEVAGGCCTPVAIVTSGLSGPRGLAVDAADNLYVANTTANTLIREAATYEGEGIIGYIPGVLASGAPFGSVTINRSGTLYSATGSTVYSLQQTSMGPLSFTSLSGVASPAQSITVENDGNAPLDQYPTPITVTGPFLLKSPSTACSLYDTIISVTEGYPPCTINIAFYPSAGGTFSGTTSIQDLSQVDANPGVVHSASLIGIATTGTTLQTITFPQPAVALYGQQITLAAFSTSGLPITYFITSGSATVAGSVVTYTGVGTVIISAGQAGNATYAAAPTVSVTVTIGVNNIWVLNSNGTLAVLSEAGTLSSALGDAGTKSTRGGLAFDSAGHAWSVASANNALVYTASGTSTPTVFTGGNLSAPSALAIDGNGNIWIANSGNNSVSEFNASGTPITVTSGYASSALTAPSSIAIDLSGSIWLSNPSKNSITEVLGAAAPSAVLSIAVTSSTVGQRP